MQIKATMRCHLTPVRIAIIKKRETEQVWVSLLKKRETLYTIGRNIKCTAAMEVQIFLKIKNGTSQIQYPHS